MKEIAGRSRSLCALEQEEDKIYYFDFFLLMLQFTRQHLTVNNMD